MWRSKDMPLIQRLEALIPGIAAYWDEYIEQFLDNMVKATELSSAHFLKELEKRSRLKNMPQGTYLIKGVFLGVAGEHLMNEAKKMGDKP